MKVAKVALKYDYQIRVSVVQFHLLCLRCVSKCLIFSRRYNITTDDYDPVNTDSKFNNDKYVLIQSFFIRSLSQNLQVKVS